MSRRITIKTSNARFAGVVLLAITFLLLTGCATGPRLSSPADMGIAERTYLPGVPFHAQREYQCGPASLAMALNASGIDVSVDTLIPQVFLPGREGSVQPEMQATVRRYDRIGFLLDGNFQSLLGELDAGHPVIVMQNLSLPAWPMWHYAVAIGYDLDEKLLTLHSGEEADRRESFRRFDATWARSDRWAMVVLPPGELPATVRPHRAMEATAAFEQASGASDALPAWHAMVKRWPAFALGWFALGNAEYASDNGEGAANAFRQAIEQDPTLAVAWLNLGLLLEESGEHTEARQALRQAATLPSQWQGEAEQAMARLSE
ncbi:MULTISPECIES: PA2778 family cysteine peptidase [Halomonadaceae]|uniref:PA2778 family cysteine peptidase n=1 Tax=Halomonadaceae TaxID=28256 RepID=UPI0015988CE2|nr:MULTISPECIES: PA2778 family cysteine peptidase [Halomonas]QJQ93991.1 PA2778 family cysteine peptidase [Halomonas sp. PA5]